MQAWDFLQEQRLRLESGCLGAVATDFDLPLVVVKGSETRILYTVSEIEEVLGGLMRDLGGQPGLAGARRVLSVQFTTIALSMLSFEDVFRDAEGQLIGSLRATYVVRRPFGPGAISIVIVERAPECFDRIFDDTKVATPAAAAIQKQLA